MYWKPFMYHIQTLNFDTRCTLNLPTTPSTKTFRISIRIYKCLVHVSPKFSARMKNFQNRRFAETTSSEDKPEGLKVCRAPRGGSARSRGHKLPILTLRSDLSCVDCAVLQQGNYTRVFLLSELIFQPSRSRRTIERIKNESFLVYI